MHYPLCWQRPGAQSLLPCHRPPAGPVLSYACIHGPRNYTRPNDGKQKRALIPATTGHCPLSLSPVNSLFGRLCVFLAKFGMGSGARVAWRPCRGAHVQPCGRARRDMDKGGRVMMGDATVQLLMAVAIRFVASCQPWIRRGA